MTDAHRIRLVTEHQVFANDYVVVHDDDVRFADGRTGRHVRIDNAGPGAGVVLVVTHGALVALVRTYRYALARAQWALPRGFAQSSDPLATAHAELDEELGIADPVSVQIIGSLTPDSGLLSTEVAVARVHVDAISVTTKDPAEVETIRWVSGPELLDMIVDGTLDDGISLAALAIARAKGTLD